MKYDRAPNFLGGHEHSHHEVVGRADALKMAEAAYEAGGVAVQATENEGEPYKTKKNINAVVPEDKIRIHLTGTDSGMKDFHGQLRTNERKIA